MATLQILATRNRHRCHGGQPVQLPAAPELPLTVALVQVPPIATSHIAQDVTGLERERCVYSRKVSPSSGRDGGLIHLNPLQLYDTLITISAPMGEEENVTSTTKTSAARFQAGYQVPGFQRTSRYTRYSRRVAFCDAEKRKRQ